MPLEYPTIHQDGSSNQNKPRHSSMFSTLTSQYKNNFCFLTFRNFFGRTLKSNVGRFFPNHVSDQRSKFILSTILQVILFHVQYNGGKKCFVDRMGYFGCSALSCHQGNNRRTTILPVWSSVLTIHPWSLLNKLHVIFLLSTERHCFFRLLLRIIILFINGAPERLLLLTSLSPSASSAKDR